MSYISTVVYIYIVWWRFTVVLKTGLGSSWGAVWFHLHLLDRYGRVKPHCSNFRIITTVFPVPVFFGFLQHWPFLSDTILLFCLPLVIACPLKVKLKCWTRCKILMKVVLVGHDIDMIKKIQNSFDTLFVSSKAKASSSDNILNYFLGALF